MTYPQQPGAYDPNTSGYVDPVTGQPAYPPVDPISGQPAYAGSPQGYPGPAYPAPAYPGYPGYPVPPQRQTNGLAIAALVLGISGVATCGVSGLIGAILGHVARRQIRENGQQEGDGMALGGIISGWITFGLALVGVGVYIVFIAFIITAAANNPSTYSTY